MSIWKGSATGATVLYTIGGPETTEYLKFVHLEAGRAYNFELELVWPLRWRRRWPVWWWRRRASPFHSTLKPSQRASLTISQIPIHVRSLCQVRY